MVSALVDLYPNGGQAAGDGYIGGLSKILMNYPRSVAIRAADPMTGVARDTKFLPTPADLVAWCERETAPMAEDYAAAKRIADRVDDKTDPAVTDRMRELAKAWKDRKDPKAQKLTGQSEVHGLKVAEDRIEANRKAMEVRREETVQEWERAGLRPVMAGNIPVSPALARMCSGWAEENRQAIADRQKDSAA